VTAAQPTLQIDNDQVRVTEWRFAPGAETGWHVHRMDYIVVPLYNGTLRIEAASGITDVELRCGASYSRLAGVEHNVINHNAFEFAFVEVELKNGSPRP
jgi:quercetin dioxygenase-like cupin family protein